MFQPHLEQLIAWATGPERKEELLRAKKEYFALAGEVFDDDKSFETRMAAFLEYWLFDRPLEVEGVPPARLFVDAHGPALEPAAREVYEGLARTVHGVFEVKKLGTREGLRIREVVGGADHEVFERRGLVGIQRGDLFEARLVPHDGRLLFSGTFLYHPREAKKAIQKELKRRKKAGEPPAPGAFARELSRMALKLERYRNVSVENIYRFS